MQEENLANMDKSEARIKKLRALVEEDGGPAEFARKRSRPDADKPIDPTFISQILNGHRSFGEKAAANMERRAGLPPRYFDDHAAEFNTDPASRPRCVVSDDVIIPQYNAGGSMGNGLILDGMAGVIKSWHVDHEWLRLNVRRHTGINNLCIVTGFGPSMRPMFNPGDPLLVDCGVTKIDSDAVYFFRVGNHGYIKTIQRIPTADGKVIYRAKSKNSDFDPFDIVEGMDFEVFGKVLTVWKSEQS